MIFLYINSKFTIYFKLLKKASLKMSDKFQNIRQVQSPSSQNSPFGSSIVMNRIGSGNINPSIVQPTKLEFASNSNLMSSQASYSSRSNNQFF